MYMAHILMRREFGLTVDVVRGVGESDVNRAGQVADHIEFISGVLHGHHAAEDALLWPKLLDRGSDDVAAVVHVMEGQHEAIDEANQGIKKELDPWCGTAAVRHRDGLAGALERLNSALVEHTALEEERILPLAEKYSPRVYASYAKRLYGTPTPPRSTV
ncbi:hemerythrin domain-containing protein [Planotetraspora thailandica]|nr:hemerythrin domain-containing protein [Planotetraspora thailandica]